MANESYTTQRDITPGAASMLERLFGRQLRWSVASMSSGHSVHVSPDDS